MPPAGPTPTVPYDPSDPTTWPGATWSTYSPAPGTDPEWDAYMATFTAQVAQRNAEATAARRRLTTEYESGVASLDAAAPGRRKELEAGLLARGIGRSGEAMRHASSLEADLYRQRADADRARLEGYNAIETGLTGNLTDLAAGREGQVAASRLRLLAAGKGVPGSSTPGAGTSGAYKPKKQPPKTGGGTAAPPQGQTGNAGVGSGGDLGTSTSPPTQKPRPDPNKPKKPATGGGVYYS